MLICKRWGILLNTEGYLKSWIIVFETFVEIIFSLQGCILHLKCIIWYTNVRMFQQVFSLTENLVLPLKKNRWEIPGHSLSYCSLSFYSMLLELQHINAELMLIRVLLLVCKERKHWIMMWSFSTLFLAKKGQC